MLTVPSLLRASLARPTTDIWTFERDLSLSDPNWKLVETESPDDE